MSVSKFLIIIATISLIIGCNRPQIPPTQILVISLDTLRSDRLSSSGNPNPVSPFLDRLSQRSLSFTEAVSPIPSTGPAHASIFTGLLPIHHKCRSTGDPLDQDAGKTLAEMLTQSGYKTFGFTSASVMWPKISGLNRGFSKYIPLPPPPKARHNPLPKKQTDPQKSHPKNKFMLTAMAHTNWESVLEKARPTLLGVDQNDPQFVFLHFYDVHQPYSHPAPFNRIFDPDYEGSVNGSITSATWFQEPDPEHPVTPRDAQHMKALYDGGIRYVDLAIETIFKLLHDTDKLQNTLVVILSDHGEGFGEWDNFFEHGDYLSDSELRVPMIVNWPSRIKSGLVPGRVGLEDITPTILELAQITVPENLDGRSLAPAIFNRVPMPPKANFIETNTIYGADGVYKQFGIVADNVKLVESAPDREHGLFDLNLDPSEQLNLWDIRPQQVSSHLKLMETMRADADTDFSIPELDSASREALQSLGYIVQ